ncbi:uncharacterized protein TNCV_261531 [Trichonephila clavipes]|nr:uncharacterized protein TNCV_261531 [Trichonephila clavipes]
MLEKVIENWMSRLDYIRASRGSPMPEIIFKIDTLIEKTEKALVIWIEDLTQKRIPLDGHLIKMKALKFYKELKESEPSTSSRESGEGFDDFGEHDIEELLVDEALNDDDILESMVDITKDLETVDSEPEDVTPLDEKLLREGLQLSGKLAKFFIQNDNDVERALKFQRDLKFFVCLATENSTKN